MSDSNKVYVYGELEVTLTGRTAIRELSRGKKHELHEITPADPELGSWKKWVPIKELYEIQ